MPSVHKSAQRHWFCLRSVRLTLLGSPTQTALKLHKCRIHSSLSTLRFCVLPELDAKGCLKCGCKTRAGAVSFVQCSSALSSSGHRCPPPPGLEGVGGEVWVGGFGWISHIVTHQSYQKKKKKQHKTAAEKKQQAKVLITNAAIRLAQAAS